MANNIWKLAEVLEPQAVADLIDVVSVDEIRENIGNILPTVLVQILNKTTDKTFARIINVTPIDSLTVLWTDQKVQERARNMGFKEPVVQSDKKLEDFVDVPDDHKRKPKTGARGTHDALDKAIDKKLAKTQGNLKSKKKSALHEVVVEAGTQLTLYMLRKIELTDEQLAELVKIMPENGKTLEENVEAMKQMRNPL